MKTTLKYIIFTSLVSIIFAAPQITHSCEKSDSDPEVVAQQLWEKWLRSKVVYRPDSQSDNGRIDFVIGELEKPESGKFSLYQCSTTWQTVTISTGRREIYDINNENLIEIWLDPVFLDRDPMSFRFPVAIYWNKGDWDLAWKRSDSIKDQTPDQLSNNNLYRKWESSTGYSNVVGYGVSALHKECYRNFTFEWAKD
jgi:hypothetical protein